MQRDKYATETTWAIVKAYEVGKPDSLATTIPKPLREHLGIKAGTRFLVKTDERGRIIYERVGEPLVR